MAELDWAKLIAQIATGGWPIWIATIILGVLGTCLYIWVQWQKAGLALAESERKAAQAQAGGVIAGQQAEAAAAQAQSEIDKIRAENPDAGKQARPKP